MLELKNISKRFKDRQILSNFNLTVEENKILAIVGPSGGGKTTLLRMLAGLEKIDSGEIIYNGESLPIDELEKRNLLGFVFQDFQLLTDRTVHANLSFVLRATGWTNKATIKARIEEVLDQVGMTGKGYKMPNELSGGEQQRIVIARAILNRPDIILADEPTGNLDTETGRKIVELLKSICATGSAIMMTTHNLHLLSEYPGVVYRFENHHIKEVTHEYSRMERSQNETEKGEKTTVTPQETAE